ncbi:MAG TPA: hypothetical protein VIN06_11440 [Devosia sp.]
MSVTARTQAGANGEAKAPPRGSNIEPLRPIPGQGRIRTGDRVAATAVVELLANRDDRVFVTVRFEGSPTPVVLDSMWTNCPICDLEVGATVQLEGTLKGVNHGGDEKWDSFSVLFDGLGHAVAVPMSQVSPLL